MPNIPTSTRVLNALLGPMSDVERAPDYVYRQLVERAELASGGTAQGDEAFLDDFRHLLRCYAKVEDMSALGWQTALADLQLRVRNRMRIRHLVRTVPGVGDEIVSAPVFVTGLPRTATVLTREAIGRSAGHRVPLLWEMVGTDLELDDRERRRRVKSVARLFKSAARLAPKYGATHEFDVERPGDATHLLPHGVHHLTRADVPDYADWLAVRDFAPDYDYLRRALQVLQHGRPPARWVLQSSAFLDHLPQIRSVFPDAVIVWIHRDPVTVMGSVCSMVEASMALHVRRPDQHRIGATWLRHLASSIERAREARVRLPRESLVEVSYAQLMADPRAVTPMLYERIGSRWTEADAANLDAALAGPGIGRSHEYELSRYGLSTSDVEAAFGDYTRTIQSMWMR